MYRLAVAVLLVLAGCAPSTAFVLPDLAESCPTAAPAPESLRVVTYNMHAGVGSSLDEVAAVLESLDADLVALQEVDRGVKRTDRTDQDVLLAERLGYRTVYAGARKRRGGDFGIALLSRLPITRAERIDLREPAAFQPRVAIDATVCVGEREVRMVSVHADIFTWSSRASLKTLTTHIEGSIGEGVILAGDLNVGHERDGPTRLRDAGMVDVLEEDPTQATFDGFGRRRLDYVFVDAPLAERRGQAAVLETPESDHFPVYADFALAPDW